MSFFGGCACFPSLFVSQTRPRISTRTPARVSYHRLPTTSLEDHYTLLPDVLGTGTNGKIHKATCKSDKDSLRLFAVKPFDLTGFTQDQVSSLERECQLYLTMDHPHVVRLVDVYESSDKLDFVVECMEGGDVFERIREKQKFSEAEAAGAAYQMLLAINYIHIRGIVHRDIKLNNFVYDKKDSSTLKLVDFGISKIWEDLQVIDDSCMICPTFFGTLSYSSPEALEGMCTAKSDMWSLGVVVFILLVGNYPFNIAGCQDLAQIPEDELNRIKAGDFTSWLANYPARIATWHGLSKEAKDFLGKLMHPNPEQRFSAREALQHGFITRSSSKRNDQSNAQTSGQVTTAIASSPCSFAGDADPLQPSTSAEDAAAQPAEKSATAKAAAEKAADEKAVVEKATVKKAAAETAAAAAAERAATKKAATEKAATKKAAEGTAAEEAAGDQAAAEKAAGEKAAAIAADKAALLALASSGLSFAEQAEKAAGEKAAAEKAAADKAPASAKEYVAHRAAAEKAAAEKVADEKVFAEKATTNKAAADQAAVVKAAAEKAATSEAAAMAAERAAAEKAADEKAFAEKAAAEKAASNKAAAIAVERAAAEKAADEKVFAEKAAADKAAAEKAAVDKASKEKAAAEQAAVEKAAAEEAATKKAAAEKAAAEEAAAEKAAAEKAAAKKATAEKVAMEKAAAEKAAAEEAAAQKAATEKAAAEKAATEKVATERAAAEKAAAEKFAIEKAAAEKAAVLKEAAENGAAEKEAAERAVAEKAAAEGGAADVSTPRGSQSAQVLAQNQDGSEVWLRGSPGGKRTCKISNGTVLDVLGRASGTVYVQVALDHSISGWAKECYVQDIAPGTPTGITRSPSFQSSFGDSCSFQSVDSIAEPPMGWPAHLPWPPGSSMSSISSASTAATAGGGSAPGNGDTPSGAPRALAQHQLKGMTQVSLLDSPGGRKTCKVPNGTVLEVLHRLEDDVHVQAANQPDKSGWAKKWNIQDIS